MRAKRIDEIRRSGAAPSSIGVGTVAIHPAWDTITDDASFTARNRHDDPHNWLRLPKYAERWKGFGQILVDMVSTRMNCDPNLIRINNSIVNSMSFDSAIKRIIHEVEGPMNRMDTSLPNGVSIEGLANVNAGAGTLIVKVERDTHSEREDYYLLKGPM